MRIRHRDDDGVEYVGDLAETLAALARDSIDDFPALRPHQRQAWHCLLVQLMTLALREDDPLAIPEEPSAWRQRLLALTPDYPDGEPWQLLVEDRSKPAFLQPPGVPAVGAKGVSLKRTPDEIDMLVTGRNHDIKGSRIERAADDSWLFALVTTQTLDGRKGPGNLGISRMNSGYGARTYIGLRPASDRWGQAVVRDVTRLQALRDRQALESPMSGTLALLWLEPWSGEKALMPGKLDPLYIEICRRFRLFRDVEGVIRCTFAASAKERIDAKALKGISGDPWAPLDADGGKVWGVSEAGFGYRQMTTLLSPEAVELPLLAEVGPDEGHEGLVLHACAIARGQGKTEGYHERRVVMPPTAARRFGRPDGRERVAREAVARRDAAGEAQRILRHALIALYQGGPEKARLDDDAAIAKARASLRSFERRVDAVFFDLAFWDCVSDAQVLAESGDRARAWRVELRSIAMRTFAEAREGAPRGGMSYLRALARSRSILEGRLRRFVDPTERGDEEPESARADRPTTDTTEAG